MTRILVAAFLTAGISAPVLAQDDMPCSREAGAIWSAVEQSQLQDAQKNEVSQVLQQAQAQEQQGDSAGCMQIVEQVKVALGMQQPPAAAPESTPVPAPQ